MGEGEGAHYPGRYDLVVPCASRPGFSVILAEWIESCANQGVSELHFYLTELGIMHCGCDRCKNSSQYLLEAKACLKAWEIVRKKYPDFRIRILLSQGSYDSNEQILSAATDTAVRISYYSGSHTYTARREPMIYPLMGDFVKKGRWLGVYPSLTASYAYVSPWSGAQFIKYRMTEIVEKGLSSFSGFAPPDHVFFDFNITASAEWSWNAHGRTEREFAVSYATQRGLNNPEIYADWVLKLGEVGWNVYGSGGLTAFTKAVTYIKERKQPKLGQDLFLYFPTVQHIENDLSACKDAIKLAESLNEPAIMAETLTIYGYMRIIKAIYEIAGLVAGQNSLSEEQTLQLQSWLTELEEAEKQTSRAYYTWVNAVFPKWKGERRVLKTFDALKQLKYDISHAIELMGI